MSKLQAAIVGFDITPEIHPQHGAWGTTPSLTTIDEPLLARCIVLEQDRKRLVWFGSDLCGNAVWETDEIRQEVADALNLPHEHLIWSTSQTHSSPTLPGSEMCGGSGVTARGKLDPQFVDAQRHRLMNAYKEAARAAIDSLQPVNIHVGKGHCNSMSYNTRFPMPTGGVKFSRHHEEGLQSEKYFDPTIGLVRFDNAQGRPLGMIFNFCCHPATMIDNTVVSPDWVGEARRHVEQVINGAPAMYVQGFCGDVNCYHIFGTPAQARRNGKRLGRSAARAMANLIPVKAEPLCFAFKSITLPCRPMYSREELEEHISARLQFIDELHDDPTACWVCGINVPEQFPPEKKAKLLEIHLDYLNEGLRLLQTGEPVRTSLDLKIGAVRLGDMAAAISPGENFTHTGARVRERSPFSHTLICGDTNGNFGYIGDDLEMDRGGYETDSYWKMLYIDGFRLALAKGTVDRILAGFDELLSGLLKPP